MTDAALYVFAVIGMLAGGWTVTMVIRKGWVQAQCILAGRHRPDIECVQACPHCGGTLKR